MENKIPSDTGVRKDIPINSKVISQYMNPGEKIVGFGIGGSESLTQGERVHRLEWPGSVQLRRGALVMPEV